MSRDDFIIWVYCLVCTHYEAVVKDHPVRCGGGFTPKLTDAEVITLEICVLRCERGVRNLFR